MHGRDENVAWQRGQPSPVCTQTLSVASLLKIGLYENVEISSNTNRSDGYETCFASRESKALFLTRALK